MWGISEHKHQAAALLRIKIVYAYAYNRHIKMVCSGKSGNVILHPSNPDGSISVRNELVFLWSVRRRRHYGILQRITKRFGPHRSAMTIPFRGGFLSTSIARGETDQP